MFCWQAGKQSVQFKHLSIFCSRHSSKAGALRDSGPAGKCLALPQIYQVALGSTGATWRMNTRTRKRAGWLTWRVVTTACGIALAVVFLMGFTLSAFLPGDMRRLAKRSAADLPTTDAVVRDVAVTVASLTVELAAQATYDDTAESLLGALVSPDPGGALELLDLRDSLDVLWKTPGAALAFSRPGQPSHDAPALFLLLSCRVHLLLSPIERTALVAAVQTVAEILSSRIDAMGRYVLEAGPVAPQRSAIRFLRQAEVAAALRCASRLLHDDGTYASLGDALVQSLHVLVDRGDAFLARMIGGLINGTVTDPGKLEDVPPSWVVGSEAEIAQSLLFLNPGDMPNRFLGRIATAAFSTAGFVGVARTVASGAVGPVYLLDQAAIALGAARHAQAQTTSAQTDSDAIVAGSALKNLAFAALRAAVLTRRLLVEAASRLGSGASCSGPVFQVDREPSSMRRTPSLPLACLTFPEFVVSTSSRLVLNWIVPQSRSEAPSLYSLLLQYSGTGPSPPRQLTRVQRLWSASREMLTRWQKFVRPSHRLPVIREAAHERGGGPEVEHVILMPFRRSSSGRLGGSRHWLQVVTAGSTVASDDFEYRGGGDPFVAGSLAATLLFQSVIARANDAVLKNGHSPNDLPPSAEQLFISLSSFLPQMAFDSLPAEHRRINGGSAAGGDNWGQTEPPTGIMSLTPAAVARAPPEETAVQPRLVHVGVLQKRICGPEAAQQPWFSDCCSSESVLRGGEVEAGSLPFFSCDSGNGLHARVSCAWVMDGLCDCAGDGSDEPASGACPLGYFFCASGVLKTTRGELALASPGLDRPQPNYKAAADAVRAGQVSQLWGLGFIPSALVRDGIPDCRDAEDEAAQDGNAVVSLHTGNH